MTSTIELTAREFRDLVSPVLPLAGTDDMLPVLNAVHLLSYDGYLVAEATDRFRWGRCRRAHEEAAGGEIDALVGVPTIRRILTLFRPGRGSGGTIRLTFDEHSITVSAADALEFGFASASLSFDLVDGEFPKVTTIVAEALAREPVAGNFGVNPHFLADFKHADDGEHTLRVRSSGPDKPLVVGAGDHFIGMLMPRKRVDGGLDIDGWDEHLSAPKKAEVAA